LGAERCNLRGIHSHTRLVDVKHASVPSTRRYYHSGSDMLLDTKDLAGLHIDQITDQHGGQFASRKSALSPSTVNYGLRTLRHALNLANEGGRSERRPKITLAKGERRRERVLPDVEIDRYLKACEQPWKDVATIRARIRKGGWAQNWHNQETGGLLPIQKSVETPLVKKRSSGEPGRTRTSNPLIKSQLLYH
jgi:hypothetical protein